jgi:hypothetical protein
VHVSPYGHVMDPDDATSGLREAIEAAHEPRAQVPMPEFSDDGGVTVFDEWGRSARLQPLGQRVRVTLVEDEHLVAEGEVDNHTLVTGIGARGSTYEAVAASLDLENGPGHRSG